VIGRDEELRVLGAVLADLRGGSGRALVLRGEAGIGKSALLAEAVRDSPGRVLRAGGVESEVEIAFSGLHQLLLPVLDEVDDLPEPQSDALRRALGSAPGETTDRLVCAAVLELLNRQAPVLVVVDDAHDIDRASLTALLFAARRLSDRPVGMLFAVRDPAPRTVDSAGLTELRLSGLDAVSAARLLDGLGAPVDGPTRDRLVAATAGNPLALATLARSADRDRWALDAINGTVPIDAALRAAFTAQLRTLPPETQAALLVAAADDTGRLDLIDQLGGGCLDPAERAELVEISGGRLRFTHPLARSAIYSAATSGRIAQDPPGDRDRPDRHGPAARPLAPVPRNDRAGRGARRRTRNRRPRGRGARRSGRDRIGPAARRPAEPGQVRSGPPDRRCCARSDARRPARGCPPAGPAGG
jgi:hypothetical protein